VPDTFDGAQFLAHLRARWRLPAAAVSAALVVAAAVSLLMPRKFTARVTLVIEPPAASNITSTAVSPIYLESLRSYEYLAASDQTFARAAAHFQLRARRSLPLEKLKKEVLRVSIPRSTKMMEISATLEDPKTAHAVALFVAEETVRLNRQTNRTGDEELLAGARRELEESERLRRAAEESYRNARKRAPNSLEAEIDRLEEMRLEVSQKLLSADLAAAEQDDRLKSPPDPRGPGSGEPEGSRADAAFWKNRARHLRAQENELDRQAAAVQKTLAERTAQLEGAEAALLAARTRHEQAERRWNDARAAAGTRGERLNVVDRGVPPERPSSPNVPLNLLVAAAFALILSFLFVTAEYGLRSRWTRASDERPWMATRL
jgi:uncharacterized protein involved in exopolysaccharide biosynthesis